MLAALLRNIGQSLLSIVKGSISYSLLLALAFPIVLVLYATLAERPKSYVIESKAIALEHEANDCAAIDASYLNKRILQEIHGLAQDLNSYRASSFRGLTVLGGRKDIFDSLREISEQNEVSRLAYLMSLGEYETIEVRFFRNNESCAFNRVAVINGDFYREVDLDTLDFRKIARTVASSVDEYFELISEDPKNFRYDHVRQRAAAYVATNVSPQWYANLLGITYLVEKRDARDDKARRELNLSARYWFEKALGFDPGFTPALLNSASAMIEDASGDDDPRNDCAAFENAVDRLLRQYYRYPERNLLGNIGVILYDQSSRSGLDCKPQEARQRAEHFLKAEISRYGGAAGYYSLLSRLYADSNRPLAAEEMQLYAQGLSRKLPNAVFNPPRADGGS